MAYDGFKLLVLHHCAEPPPSSREIVEEARKLGARARYVRLQDLSVHLGKKLEILKGLKPLEADVAFIRGVGYALSIEQYFHRSAVLRALESCGTVTINSSAAVEVARNKALALATLARAGVPVPPTLATESLSKALKFVEEVQAAVVKPVVGSMGRGVMLLKDVDTAYSVLKQLLSWAQPLLLQKYYNKKGSRDLRVLVVSGQAYAAYYRVARPGTFKTNVAQGARVEPASDAEEAKELAVKATEALGLFYAGVDVMETDEGLYVLEVNASPNWKGAKILGLNPAKKLVEEALHLVKK